MVIIRPLICLVQTDDCSNSDACCCNEKPRSLNGDTGTICFMEIKFWPRLSHQVTAFHQVLNVMFFNAFFFCYMTFKALWECRKTDSSADFKFSFICLEQCIQVSWPERLRVGSLICNSVFCRSVVFSLSIFMPVWSFMWTVKHWSCSDFFRRKRRTWNLGVTRLIFTVRCLIAL